MCVILCFEDEYPKLSMLKDAEATNPHGGGMSWIKDGKVRWMKGKEMNPKNIMKLIKKGDIQLPIIIHYRIATHGAINNMMCHPFPIGKGERNAESGITEEGVMFHNGVWSDYDEYAMKFCMSTGHKIPDGDMSDSSVMAFIASHIGQNFFTFTDEKVIAMTPKGITRYGDGWVDVDGIKCSNDLFEPTPYFESYGTGFGKWYGKSDKDSREKAFEEAEGAQSTLDGEPIPLSLSDYEDEYYERDQIRKAKKFEEQAFYNQYEMEGIDGVDEFD